MGTYYLGPRTYPIGSGCTPQLSEILVQKMKKFFFIIKVKIKGKKNEGKKNFEIFFSKTKVVMNY